MVTAGCVAHTQYGPGIVILHQYAYTGKGKIIHSCTQLGWFNNDRNDKSIKVSGGRQHISIIDGYVFCSICTLGLHISH